MLARLSCIVIAFVLIQLVLGNIWAWLSTNVIFSTADYSEMFWTFVIGFTLIELVRNYNQYRDTGDTKVLKFIREGD